MTKRSVFCPHCEDIFDVPAKPAIWTCEECGSQCQPYQRWDNGMEEGCRYERAFGDGSDLG